MSNDNSIISEVKNKLINVLETYCPDNVYLQGTLNSEETYPQKFVTFFINSTQLNAFYDNHENEADFYISVIFYSNNPAEVSEYGEQIMSALAYNGFIIENGGSDIISDVQTHTGWAFDCIYPKRA